MIQKMSEVHILWGTLVFGLEVWVSGFSDAFQVTEALFPLRFISLLARLVGNVSQWV